MVKTICNTELMKCFKAKTTALQGKHCLWTKEGFRHCTSLESSQALVWHLFSQSL